MTEQTVAGRWLVRRSRVPTLLMLGGLLLAGSAAIAAPKIKLVRGSRVARLLPTVQAAVDAAAPGDIVRLPAGTYFECVTVSRSGSAGRPITLEGEGSRAAVLDGAHPGWTLPNREWRKLEGGLYAASAPRFWIINEWSMPSAALRGGERLWSYRSREELTRFAVGSGVYFDKGGSRMLLRFSDGGDPGRRPLSISRCEAALLFSGAHDWRVRNLAVQNGAFATVAIGQPGHPATQIELDQVTVQNGLNGVLTLDRRTSDNVVHHSVISTRFPASWYWSDFKQVRTGMEGGAIGVLDAGAGNRFHDNDIHGFFDGIDTYARHDLQANSNTWFYRNRVHHLLDDGIDLESGDVGTRVFENVFYDTFAGISLAPVRKGPTYVYRNLVVADREINYDRRTRQRGKPVAFKCGANETAPRNVMIYHNTAISRNQVLGGVWGGKIFSRDFKWWNNIFYAKGGLVVEGSGWATQGNAFDGNLYFKEGVGPLILGWNCGSSGCPRFNTLEEARRSREGRAAGWEAHGLQANPRLRQASGPVPEPRFEPGSPARDRAVPLPAWCPDTVKASGKAKDIGAWEHR